MNGDPNPTLPLVFDVSWMVIVLLRAVSTVIAVVSIMRARHQLRRPAFRARRDRVVRLMVSATTNRTATTT